PGPAGPSRRPGSGRDGGRNPSTSPWQRRPRHGDLAHGVAAPDVARLPPLRRPARGAADPPAAQALLRRARRDAGRDQPQAPRLHGAARGGGAVRAPGPAWPDELPEDAVEVRVRLQPRPPVQRPPAAGDVPDAPAGGGGGEAGRPRSVRAPAGARGGLMNVGDPAMAPLALQTRGATPPSDSPGQRAPRSQRLAAVTAIGL